MACLRAYRALCGLGRGGGAGVGLEHGIGRLRELHRKRLQPAGAALLLRLLRQLLRLAGFRLRLAELRL